MSHSRSLPAMAIFPAIPREVSWAYLVFFAVFLIGLAVIFLSGDWQKSRGLDKVILFGPLFYAAPVAAFGSEHFTLTKVIASIVPKYIPWHLFWAYFVGTCFIVGGFALVARIQNRLAASLFGLTFFLFVVLMDAPGWAKQPHSRFAAALTLRELSFSGGALALAATLMRQGRESGTRVLATIARYFIAVPVLFYSVEQFLHADHVPGIPLEKVMPAYIFGHSFWTYLAAAVYAIGGVFLLVGKKTRAAATWVGLTVLVVELAVYLPIAVMERASLEGFNYMADTLMYCGAVLLLAGAMTRAAQQEEMVPASSVQSAYR